MPKLPREDFPEENEDPWHPTDEDSGRYGDQDYEAAPEEPDLGWDDEQEYPF